MAVVKRSVKDDDFSLALNSAYRILKARSRSEAEMTTRLIEKGFAQDVVSKVLGRLKSQRYLNDPALAADLADKYRTAGESDAKVRERLLSRGLTEKCVNDVLSVENVSPEDNRVWDALQKRAKTLTNAPPAVVIRRLTNYLARQGYEPDVIELAMERFVAESNFNEEN